MEDNPIQRGELCDGNCCVIRLDCARYSGNAPEGDTRPVRRRNPWPEYCPDFLSCEQDDYGDNGDTGH